MQARGIEAAALAPVGDDRLQVGHPKIVYRTQQRSVPCAQTSFVIWRHGFSSAVRSPTWFLQSS